MKLALTPMTLRDVPFFNAVRNECREFLHNPQAHTLPEAARWFAETAPRYLILLGDDLPVGYFRITEARSEAEIGLDIHKDYRGQGLARPAYQLLFAYLRLRQFEKVTLRVLRSNARAIHIYRAIGFVVTEETEIDLAMMRHCAECGRP